jgi:hypothetical protein
MLRGILTIASTLTIVALASPALGQGKKGKDQTNYDFDGDVIETEYMKPDQLTIEAISKRQNEGFIKIRTDFVKEIVRSAEDL